MSLCRLLLTMLVPTLTVTVTGPSQAADVRWGDRPVQYTTVEPKDLRTFLREFAAQQGMAVSIDPEVKGELSGRYNLSPRSMMELLSRTYGLIYYFDGKVLFVYPSTAVDSDVIRLTETTPAQLQRTLDRLGISDSRYPLTVDPERSTVMVSGPRRFVELVRMSAAAAERVPRKNEAAVTATRVVQLNYAFAEDHVVRSGGRDYRVQGVVSILRQTFSQGWRSERQREDRTLALPRTDPPKSDNQPLLPVLQGGRRGAQASNSAVPNAPSSLTPSSDAESELPQRPSPGAQPQLPMFSADGRTNSIVIRDLPSRLDEYEDLIRSLDLRPQLVELEVNIVEVNGDAFEALGIDWKGLGTDASLEIGSGSVADRVVNPRGNSPDPQVPITRGGSIGNVQGAVFALLTGGRSLLVARISALEQTGKATVRAQPRVLTLNNIEAVLESISTFYVRVEGFQDAQLFDVNVGTSVRLLPSVITAALDSNNPLDKQQLVRMLVRIEDGALTEQSVDRVPVVQRSNISTQAVMLDGSTLLIAGYSHERVREIRNAVPLLSNIPIIGNLFKSNSTSSQRLERLFMITPHVLDLSKVGISRPAPIGQPPGWQ